MAIDARPSGELNEMQPNEESEPGPQTAENHTDGETVGYPGVADEPDSAAVDADPDDATPGSPHVRDADIDRKPNRRWRPRTPVGWALVAGAIMFVALSALTGWLSSRAQESHAADQHRRELLEVGRQGAVNLTTIDYRHADADIKRILDSATGTFYDDFSKRAQPFVDVVKQSQSTSQGTVTGAGIEAETPQGADVLVAVTVKTSNIGAQQQDPRLWRMRISVQRVGSQDKVANVAFVP